jgi:hypothetical protein
MAHASPFPAGTDQQTTRDASSVAFTGGDFKRDWNDAARFGRSSAFDYSDARPTSRLDNRGADASGVRRYRGPGHPLATGDGHP